MWDCAEQREEVHYFDELFRFVVCYKCEGYGHNPSTCTFSSTTYAGYEQGSSTWIQYQEPWHESGWNSQANSLCEPSTSSVHTSDQWDNFQPAPPSSSNDRSLLGMKETLLSIYQMSQPLPMTSEQQDKFESSIEELFCIIKLARMQGRELGAEEKQFFQEFVEASQELLQSTLPCPEHKTPTIETPVPWPAPNDPSLYMYCNNNLWEQVEEERAEEKVDDSTAYLLENPPPWPASNDPMFTMPWLPAEEPSLSPTIEWSNDNEEEFKRELLPYAMEEEDTSIFPHGDEQAPLKHLWEFSNNVGVDKDNPRCLIEEEEQPINELAPPTLEEQPPCTSYHGDFTESFPPSHYPSQQEEGQIFELKTEFIDMILPQDFEERKGLTWSTFCCPSDEELLQFPKTKQQKEGMIRETFVFAFPRVGVG